MEHIERKQCSKCLTYQALECFHRQGDSRRPRCKTCRAAARTANKYNITEDLIINLHLLQGNKCAICNKGDVKLCVDHSHDTGRVRGLLCAKCNTGLGLLGDNYEFLLAGLRYLQFTPMYRLEEMISSGDKV